MNSLKKTSLEIALETISASCGFELTKDDVSIKDVVYQETGHFNTKATLVPVPGRGYTEKVEFEYDRINIANLFLGVDVKVLPGNQKLVSDYLVAINDKYGLYLDETDIVDGDLSSGVPPFKFKLKIQDGNPAFYGQIDVIVIDEEKSLKPLLIKINGARVNSLIANGLKPNTVNGHMLTYGNDYSDIKRFLLTLNINDGLSQTFVTELNYYTNTPWVFKDSLMDFNLYGAKVVYNGLTELCNEPCNKDLYSNVAVIELNEQYCGNVFTHLVLHYNV